MDRICCCVIDKLNALAPSGRYVVVSVEELFESFPEDAEKSYAELKKALKTLSFDGFIDIKYQDGEFFCAAPLKKFIPPEEPEPSAPPPPAEKKTGAKSGKLTDFFIMFSAAFLGGAAGSLITALIFTAV